jgi:hypothetical protein
MSWDPARGALTAPSSGSTAGGQFLGVVRWMRYGSPDYGGSGRPQFIRTLVMLAATLVSLSAGALVAPAAGTPANRVTPSLVQLGIEPGALQPAGPVPRPPVEAPGPRPRPVLLLSLLVVPLLGGVYWAQARRAPAVGPARLWRRSWSVRLPARAPPHPTA